MSFQGIGGVFLYARDAAALVAWYEDLLGLELLHYGDSWFIELPAANRVPSDRKATLTFAIFPAEGELSSQATARVNYRVTELEALLARLEAKGVAEDRPRSVADYGTFAWIRDPEGNLVELWEPPAEGSPSPEDA